MPAETDPIRTVMTEQEAEAQARQIIADFATSYRDPSPVPVVGSAPPVAQPGRPPMSPAATDASMLMIAGGISTALVGGTAAGLMYFSQFADPVVCAIVFGAPAVLVLALSRLVRRAKDVMPAEQHHHYSGTVYQQHQTVTNQNRLFGRTTNNL